MELENCTGSAFSSVHFLLFTQVHYMYFAAFLFWVTGIVALIISLMTSPDEQYKVRNLRIFKTTTATSTILYCYVPN